MNSVPQMYTQDSLGLIIELIYRKNDLNHTQKYVLRLFKIVINQIECSRLEQRSVIKFFLTKKCKLCVIYRKMCDVYREACFSQKMFTNDHNIGLPPQALVE